MKKLCVSLVSMVAFVGVAAASPAAHAAEAPKAAPGTAHLVVVQALPDQTVDVSVDGDTVGERSSTGSVLGPFDLAAGRHSVTFTNAAGLEVLSTEVSLAAGSHRDLVVHLPAELGGDPVATEYDTPTQPIKGDKARVLIAHTASVAPADVRVDGAVVFRNIANGEFAVADVPAGKHVAELLPSGFTRRPILGPIKVELPASAVTMVYAVGDPKKEGMEVIAHTVQVAASAARAPRRIHAGSAGLVADVEVTPFTRRSTASASGSYDTAALGGASALLVLGLALGLARRRRAAEALR